MNARKQLSKLLVRKPRQAESGQAIVLLALVMLGLVAILGMAIDGGGLYLLWRNAQNATDAAALAGSYAKCTKGNIDQAVKDAAAKNGFDNNGTTNTVNWYNPPRPGHEKAGDASFIEVEITAYKPSYFIQVVYRDPLKVTNSAVGLCDPPFDPSMVGGLWAGSQTCENTMNWTGANSYIEGGIFSNNQVRLTGSGITIKGPVEAVDTVETANSGNVTFDPAFPPQNGVPVREDPLNLDYQMYAPGGIIYETLKAQGYKVYNVSDGDPDYNPSKKLWAPAKRTLEGLYFVDGDVNFQSGLTFGSQGITVVTKRDDSGKYGQITVNSLKEPIKYYAPVRTTPIGSRKVYYPAIIFFSGYVTPPDKCYDGIDFSGNKITVTGVMYSRKSGISVSGSELAMYGSVVANDINYSASDGTFIYDPTLVPPRPPAIQMAQ